MKLIGASSQVELRANRAENNKLQISLCTIRQEPLSKLLMAIPLPLSVANPSFPHFMGPQYNCRGRIWTMRCYPCLCRIFRPTQKQAFGCVCSYRTGGGATAGTFSRGNLNLARKIGANPGYSGRTNDSIWCKMSRRPHQLRVVVPNPAGPTTTTTTTASTENGRFNFLVGQF